ncbi:PilZ domain-containing protein [Aliikangiella sp. IMCC44653]
MIDIDDLRAQTRFKSELSIIISFPNQFDENVMDAIDCKTEDISVSGLKVISHQPIPLEYIFPIEIKWLREGVEFCFSGEVKWCLQTDEQPTFNIGIKLHELLENSIENWFEFVEQVTGGKAQAELGTRS